MLQFGSSKNVGARVGTVVTTVGTLVGGLLGADGVGPFVELSVSAKVGVLVGALLIELDGPEGASDTEGMVEISGVNVALSVDVAKIPSVGKANTK